MKDKLIEKQKKLIELMDRYFVAKTRPSLNELIEYEALKDAIIELEYKYHNLAEIKTRKNGNKS